MFKVSKNLNIDELKVSDSFPNTAKAMILTDKVMLCSMLLADRVIEKLYSKFGKKSIKILSCIRDTDLNKKVGGEPNSEHLDGIAVDITTMDINLNVEELVKWVLNDSDIDYRTFIFYPNRNFFHISINVPFRIQYKKTLISEQLKGQPKKYVQIEKTKYKNLIEEKIK